MAMTGSVSLLAVALVAACGERRHLAGDTFLTQSDGGAHDGSGGVGGGAGTGGGSPVTVGTGGALATPGSGGVTAPAGTGGPAVPIARPLAVRAQQAVTRATRLLWQAAPDASLLSRADAGAFATTEDVRKLALQLMIDARAQTGVGAFYRWWLDLGTLKDVAKDPVLFPQFNVDLSADMAAETQTFGVQVTLDGDGLFATLLTAPYSYVNERLASVYGLSGVTGTNLRRMALDPNLRAGIITQPALLIRTGNPKHTSPTKRGIFINSKMLCREIPPPPPEVPTDLLPVTPINGTTRQRFEQAISLPQCLACHAQTDGIGFGLENFDAIGQYRTTDNMLPVDASGTMGGVPFIGAVQLARLLASTPEAQVCMARKWVEYALGRLLTDADATAVSEAHALFLASGLNLRELIAGVIQSDVFLTQPVCTPGLNQTCNDSPMVSSYRGACNEAARCDCTTGLPNPATGRCP